MGVGKRGTVRTNTYCHVPSDLCTFPYKLLDCSYWARGDVFLVIRDCQQVVRFVLESSTSLEDEHNTTVFGEP